MASDCQRDARPGVRSARSVAAHPQIVTVALASSTLAYAISQTMVIPAIPQISVDLAADEASVAWVMTAFFISSAVCTGIVGRLGDMFGKRRMLLAAITAYAAGAVLSAFAPSLPVLVLGRVVMGSGAGMVPLAFAIARDEVHPSKVSTAMGTIAMMIGLGAGIGMILGGVLVDAVSWHASFTVAAALSGLAFALTALVVPVSSIRSPARVDVAGALLLAGGLGGVLMAITRTAAWGSSDPRVLGLALIGFSLLALLVVVESRRADPLLHLATLRIRPVLFTNLATFSMGVGQIAVSILVVQVAQLPVSRGGLGADASAAALLIIPYSVTMVIGSQLAGRSAGRYGGRTILVTGAVLATTGLVGLAIAPVTAAWLWSLAGLSGLGISMTLVAAPYLIAEAVPRSRTGEANGANTIARAVGQGLGTQVTATTIAAHVAKASDIPSAGAYSVAFWMSAAACGSAIVWGAAISRLHRSVQVPAGIDADRLPRGAVTPGEGDHLLGDVIP